MNKLYSDLFKWENKLKIVEKINAQFSSAFK